MKIIFGSNNTLSSWLIRSFTWSKWSHCGVIVGDTVYESTAKDGVSATTLDEFQSRYTDTLITEIPHLQGYEQKLISKLGKSYDWWGVIGFVFRRDWANTDKWFCFEYVAYASGIFNAKYLNRVTANHLLMVSK